MAYALFAAVAMFMLIAPTRAHAWGASAERLIVNRAIDSLPPELRGFFDVNRQNLTRRVVEPLDWLEKNPVGERRNHFIYLDHYGKFPFEVLPQNYKTALAKYSKFKLESAGVLPWQIGVYSEKLTSAFRDHDWEQVRLQSAYLAAYVAQASDPFHTTENFDGKLSGQPGADIRFGTSLVDRYANFFPMRPSDAMFLPDTTSHAFESCLSAHASLESILLADRRARAGFSDYTDEYYDRFYNLVGAIVVRQLSEASTDVGSYWLTAWMNAGRPQLPAQ